MDTLKVGSQAPNFKGVDQDGKEISLSDFKEKKLVLYFYPKASTPRCTAESCDFRDNYQSLIGKGFSIVGVSADSIKRQNNFAEKNALPFPLIADEKLEIIKEYGCWGSKKLYGREYEGIFRKTFLINENGIIEIIIEKVKTKAATQQLLAALESKK
ncbi:MAG: thioredoxin-dependent thiol peroxidase [Bacteroidales bacterium]|jgi:peroxiredoxin Q/BCP|nr:thioredoxin-dependent thiol peroxidase [Bacteroidales bacterium]